MITKSTESAESRESSESGEDLRHAGVFIKCKNCKGTGKVKGKHNYNIQSSDVRRLLGIMGRNKLSIEKTAKLLEVTDSSVYGWLHAKSNPKGDIRKIYFLCLKLRGYK